MIALLTVAIASGDQQLPLAVGVHTRPLVRLAKAHRPTPRAVLGSFEAARVLLHVHAVTVLQGTWQHGMW